MAEGPGASSTDHSTLEPTAEIKKRTSHVLILFLCFLPSLSRFQLQEITCNTSCHVPTGGNDSSSYLRFDIYEELLLFYVGFVEFRKCKHNTGETRVLSSFSVNINIDY